jgi:hypothetical protein
MVFECTDFPHTCRVIGDKIAELSMETCECQRRKIDELLQVYAMLIVQSAQEAE